MLSANNIYNMLAAFLAVFGFQDDKFCLNVSLNLNMKQQQTTSWQ